MQLKKTVYMLIGIAALGVSGCFSDPHHQGNYVDILAFKEKVGVWTKEDVEKDFGTPSFVDSKRENIVYYNGEQGVSSSFSAPNIHKSATIRIEYDKSGLLKAVSTVEKNKQAS